MTPVLSIHDKFIQTFSQSGEDVIIQKYFGNYVGSLLSIGENDGITFSNAFALIQRGWSAVLMEPSPVAYERLHDLHHDNENVFLMPFALGHTNGQFTFYHSGEMLGSGDVGLVSSFKKEETKRWDSLQVNFEEVKAMMINFDTLLEKSPLAEFDFITIDVEGMELDILPQIDFKKLNTKVLCVEFNGKNIQKYFEIMKPYGFTLIHQNQENLIYAL